MARRADRYTPEQVFYAAACAFAERAGIQPRYVELFRDDLADPEAVDTLAERDPGIRIAIEDVAEPMSYLAALAQAAGRQLVWSQIADQLPVPRVVAVPIRGTVR